MRRVRPNIRMHTDAQAAGVRGVRHHTAEAGVTIPRDTLGLAGEFAVASELCKRGIYAQLTLGNRKRTDLLVETDASMLRIQVKSKQKREWPGVKGISGDDIVLVFVDFEKKSPKSRPDFYVLTPSDWKQVIRARLIDTGSVKRKEVTISDQNVPTWQDGYIGVGVRTADIERFKDCWEKVERCLTRRSTRTRAKTARAG